jgi:trk system potassium uptake protein TrkH
MRFRQTLSGVGIILLAYPIAFIVPIITGILYNEDPLSILRSFVLPALYSLSLGSFMTSFGGWSPRNKLDLRASEALGVVAVSWLLIAGIGALPYVLMDTLPNYIDAYFESMSGFTTTGASVISEIDGLEHSILIWRSLTQWLGGLGVIVLMVALFSMILSGPKAGMLLMKGEVPGHKNDRIVHRIKDTAKILWTIYVILTIAEIILLTVFGMSLFDAVNHTFTTLSTGGYGTHTTSITYYSNLAPAPILEGILTLFMFIGGVNFVLHYNFVIKGVKSYLKDPEFRVYLAVMGGLWLIVSIDLILNNIYSPLESIRNAVFTVTSIQTTTGYVTGDYATWPSFSRFLILVAMFIGGMTGSTGGGMKIARFIIAYKGVERSLKRLGHPRSSIPLRVANVILNEKIVRGVGLFIFAYLSIFIVSSFVISLTGPDALSSIAAVAATLGNVGPGLGIVGPTSNYSSLHYSAKVILSILMWFGRLEIFTCLIFLNPAIYRRRY